MSTLRLQRHRRIALLERDVTGSTLDSPRLIQRSVVADRVTPRTLELPPKPVEHGRVVAPGGTRSAERDALRISGPLRLHRHEAHRADVPDPRRRDAGPRRT